MKLFCFSIVLFVLGFSWTQEIHFETFSVENGLPRSGVYSLMQDDKGFLWIGTEGGGVCFYDGKKFTTLTVEQGLLDNNVRKVFQDSESGYWFATAKGVSYLSKGKITNFTKKNGLEDNFARYIEEDDKGNIWIATNQGVSVFNLASLKITKQSKFNFSLPHRKVRSLLFDGESMWYGTDAGLCGMVDGKLKIITTVEGLTDNKVLCMYKGEEDEFYVGTNAGLNIIRDGEVVKTYTVTDGLMNDRIRSIIIDKYGRIGVGTRFGFALIDRGNNHIVNLTENNGLTNNRIRSVIVDDNYNIWIGTYFGGIMKHTPGDFLTIKKKNGILSDQVLHVFEDEYNHIILGTNEGVSKLEFEHDLISKVTNITEEDGLIFPEVNYVFKDNKGYYWYGTSNGISIFKKNKHIRNIEISDGLVDADINVIKELYDNEIWVGTKDGVSIFKMKDSEEFEYTVESHSSGSGLSGWDVTFIEKDENGDVWIGFRNGDINIFSEGRIVQPKNNKIKFSINTGIIDSKNQIWLGTEGGGLLKVNYNKIEQKIDLQKFSINEGLMSNFIYSISESSMGNLWLGTEKGASKIVWKPNGAIEYVRSYSAQEGFEGLENNTNSILTDSKGNIWFGTVRGLMYLLERNENGTKTESPIYFTNITANDFSYDWFDIENTEGVFKAPDNIQISYDNNYLELSFTGLCLSNPSRIEYSWKFEKEEGWSTFSKQNFIRFTNLDPGKYKIQVRSRTPENVINSEPISFSFVVVEPFYMNFWFRVFVGLCLFGLGYLIYLWRLKNLKRQKIDLENIVTSRTQEISLQNDQLFDKNKEITDSINYAKRIQDSIIPSEERVKSILGEESFVLFKPKDIVSGDFYWTKEIDSNCAIFCVADCTGHGVPGAMVSLVGIDALNKAVGEFKLYKPSDILDRVNILLNEAFSSQGKSVSDGMDIAICKLTKTESKVMLEYSGGNNSLWVFNPNRTETPKISTPILDAKKNEVGFAIKANKFGVGLDYACESFTNHEIELFKGDEVIIFTDGYADQFGGEYKDAILKGKKFKYSRLKQLLTDVHFEHLSYQKEVLDKTIEEWRGDIEQIDDICIIGVKI